MKISDIETLQDAFGHPMSDADFIKANAHILDHLARNGRLYQTMEMHSAYVDTHRGIAPAKAVIPEHTHSFYELLYCRSDSHVAYQVGDARFTLQRGDIVCVCPGVLHRPIFPEHMEEPYIRDVIWINADFLSTVLSSLMPDADPAGPSGLYRLTGMQSSSIGDLFRKGVLEAEVRESGWETAVVANTLTILVQLRRAAAQEKPPARTDLLDEILNYVALHWSEKITISEVAKHFFVSESTITQTFRARMGISFYRFVTRRRLAAAKDLIKQGIPLENVAEQSGFSDYSAFFRAFKQEFGMSPRQYRKELPEGK